MGVVPHNASPLKFNTIRNISEDFGLGGDGRDHSGFWWGRLREADHLENLGVDGRIFKKWDGGTWTALIWLRIGSGG
jgi:hypothetical protein